MKTKASLILMLLMLVGAACAPAAPAAPASTDTPIPAATATAPASACPAPAADTKLLTNEQDGYCLLYPAEDSADTPGMLVINPVSAPGDMPGDAWVYITVEDAAGRTLDQLKQEFQATAATGFNVTIQDIQVDGNPGVVVDGLPGQDSNRMVFILHGARLYSLTFMPWYPDEAQTTPLEHLYETVVQSMHFLSPA